MKLTLESLYKDHDNLRRILYLLEQLLIDYCRKSSQDYSMLQRILAYIQDYPERVHHPAEDAMFSFILRGGIINEKFRKDIKSLMKDHSEIEDITRKIIVEVESMTVNTVTYIKYIRERLSVLIDRQRSHILFEEMNIYPYIADYLDSEDWENISALIPDHEDPIFGEKIRKEYELIFKALL